MKIYYLHAVIFSLLATISLNCRATDENCPTKHSLGWCIADLTGLSQGLQDASKEDLDMVLAGVKSTAPDSSGVDTATLIHAGLDFAKIGYTPGLLSSSGWGAFWLLNSFGQFKLANQPHMFLILPESEVKDNDPRGTAEKAWVQGLMDFLHATNATFTEKVQKPTFGGAFIIRRYTYSGGDCGEQGCSAYARFIDYTPEAIKDTKNAYLAKVLDTPPKWLAEEKVYIWGFNHSPWPIGHGLDADPKAALVPPEKAMEFIRHLPKWFYLYMPGKVQSVINSEKVLFLAR